MNGFQGGTDEAGAKSMEEMVMNEVKRYSIRNSLNGWMKLIIFNALGDEDFAPHH